jgi:ABC-type sugar transport system substrate-binding protein
VNSLRLSSALTLLALAVAGCQPLAPIASQPLAQSSHAADGQLAPRDDDTFFGRLTSSTRQAAETVSKPLDPTYWQQKQQQSQLAKQQKKKQEAQAKRRKVQPPRSAFMEWLFPEPKKPRTLSEWLSQERPEA